MICSLNLFRNVRKFYQTLGIYPPIQSHHQAFSLNGKNLFFLLSLVVPFTFAVAYFLFRAQSIQEFGIPFCASVIILSSFGINVIQIWRSAETYQLIEHFEHFINKSEFRIYLMRSIIYFPNGNFLYRIGTQFVCCVERENRTNFDMDAFLSDVLKHCWSDGATIHSEYDQLFRL